MGSLVLTGDTSGSVTVAVPAVAGTNTATFPAATGTVMVSGNMPAFSAYMFASSQSVTSGTFTKVQFDTKTFDTATAYNTSTYRFTAPIAGYYQISASVDLNTTSAGLFYIWSIYKNGTEYNRMFDLRVLSTAGVTESHSSGSSLIYLALNDYIEIYGYINGSTATFAGGSPTVSFFSGSLVRAA
jgi:hypothetical protein